MDCVAPGFASIGSEVITLCAMLYAPCLVPKIVFKADLEILHDIFLAVDNEDAVLDMEEFLDQSLHGVECLRILSVPPLQLFFKHHNQLILHP